MSLRILQINFKYNVPREEFEQAEFPLAPEFAYVHGLRWKIWLVNEAESEAGGILLFDGQDSVNAFLASPLAVKVIGHPALSDFSVKQFDVQEGVTAITRGPI